MKKINLLLLFVSIISLTYITSCTTEEKADPTIDFVAEGGSITADITDLEIGHEIQFIINVNQSIDTKKNLKTFKVSSITNNATRIDSTVENINADHKKMTFTFHTDTTYNSEEVFTFILTDKAGVSFSRTITIKTKVAPVVEPEDTDLDAAVALDWHRCGSDEIDITSFGLDMGITYGTSPNYFFKILKDGDKLISLTTAEWTSITTKEALKTAVDNGTDLTAIEGFDASGATTGSGTSKVYDVVFATQKGTDYFMVNITSGLLTDMSLTGCGSEVRFYGETKK